MDTKINEDAEDHAGELPLATNDLDVSESKMEGLGRELAETRAKLTAAQMELEKSEALRTEAEKSNTELRRKVETLSQELDDLRAAGKKSVAQVACQVDMLATVAPPTEGAAAGSAGASDWVTEVGTSNQSTSQSVADSVRAVAEATAARTGFVLDQTSGMYYECNSGYYYDQVNKLYYDPNSGIYYYFDEETSSYQFHSQVELPPSAGPGQVHRGKGRGGSLGKRKGRDVDEMRREPPEDMDCQIIETGQDTRHKHKRRRRDVSRERLRSSSERDGNAALGRAHREMRRRRERRIHGHDDDVVAQVEVAGTEHAHQLDERVRSRERRRKRRQESGNRRRKKEKSFGRKRGDGNGDRRNVKKQEDEETLDRISDGEVKADGGVELDGLEEGGSRSQKNHKTAHQKRNRSTENEGAENNTDEGVDGRDAAATSEKQKQKDKTSPETIRGSSESSTAKDDSPSGEEGKNDEGKVEGQSSPDEVGRHRRVIIGNPDAERNQGQTEETPNPVSLVRSGGDSQEGYSDGEIVEDVMIIEDGQELIILSSDAMEEGELSDSLSDISSSEGSSLEFPSATSEDDLEEISVDSDSSGGLEVLKVDYPPCIRMIVTKSDMLKPGSLFIITCEGGTIGREGSSHAILIQSVKVSKRHAHVVYNAEERRYTIVDLGSQNGTLLNGKAISEQRVVSEPYPLSHRDYITIGGTTLRLHIHPGDETCEECEPGQVQALIAMQQLSQLSAGTASGSKHDKEQQRRKELRHLKKKFNLIQEDYASQQDPAVANPAYADRAGQRRRTAGSDNPYLPDDQPASVDRAIGSTNLGHKLLSKMGWAEGQSLGKGDRGIREPIQAVVHSRNSGLGSGTVQTLDQVQYAKRRHDKWDKARGRFNLIDPQRPVAAKMGKKALTWVQGETEKMDADRQQGAKLEDRSGAGVFGIVQLPLAGREKGAVMSQKITDIWDESMEVSNLAHHGKLGRSPSHGHGSSSKNTGATVCSKDLTAGNDAKQKQYNTPKEYERLLLGEEVDDKTNEGADELVDAQSTVDGSPNDVQASSGCRSGRDRPRQLEQGDEDVSPLSPTPASNAGGGNDSEPTAQADYSSVDDSNTRPADEPILDADSNRLQTTVESTEKTTTVNSEHLSLPDQNAQTERPENLNRPDESVSPLSQTPDGNQEAAANKNETENGRSPKLLPQPDLEGAEPAEAAGGSSDKGKRIQLKWNKGGKEKVTANLVAFEESESEEEGGDGAANESKSAERKQTRPPRKTTQEKGDRGSRRRRGAGTTSRWSSSRNSSGK